LPIKWNKSIDSPIIRPSIFSAKKADIIEAVEPTKLAVADEAVVKFVDCAIEKVWSENDDGTLLEFAEDNGLTPAFGCRAGSCGVCKVQLLSGNIIYEKEVSAPVSEGEILLCCAVPATYDIDGLANLVIKL